MLKFIRTISYKKESTFISDNKSRLYELAQRLNEIEERSSQKKSKKKDTTDTSELLTDFRR